MARRDLTVWSAIFDDLLVTGVFSGRLKLNGAPFYVHQVRAVASQKWVAKILRKNAEPLLQADSAEACKAEVERLCATKVTEWREGYWDDDVWQPRTSRPAPVSIASVAAETAECLAEKRRGRANKEARV